MKKWKEVKGHIHFWLWGAMHYKRFDQFQIRLLPPIWIAPTYFHKPTKELILILGVRFPQIVVLEPTYTDIYINNSGNKLPEIDWGKELQPF